MRHIPPQQSSPATKGKLRGVLALIVTIAACSERSVTVADPVVVRQDALPSQVDSWRQFLPYGLSIPETARLTQVPEPYQVAKHGPAFPNSQPNANLVGRPGFVSPPSPGRWAKYPPPLVTGSQSYSMSINPNPASQFFGIYQNHDVQLSVQLPSTTGSPRYLYSPTLLPSGGTCVEATTMHTRSAGASTIHQQGWFNWCVPGGTWWVIEDMNASFQNKYVRFMNGELALSISIVTPNDGDTRAGCWYGHLYNFTVGGWEQKFGYCGATTYSPSANGGNSGWTAWESTNLVAPGSCPSLQGVRAMSIQVNVSSSGGVQYLSDFWPGPIVGSGSSSPYCWTNVGGSPYTFSFPASGLVSSWRADTPTQ